MAINRFQRLLTGTALAVVLMSAPSAFAAPDAPSAPNTPDEISAAVPVPPAADLRPLTPADVGESDRSPTATVATPVQPPAAQQQSAASTPSASAVAAKLKELLEAKSDRIFASRKDRTAVSEFYAARDYAPIWVTDAGAQDRAKAAVAYLGSVESEGLEPADYPTPSLTGGLSTDALAEAELQLSSSVYTFARHAQNGRMHFSRVSADIFYAQEAPEAVDVLGKLASASDVAAALASYNPQHPQYKALKAKLAEARGASPDHKGPARIPSGPTLKLSKKKMQDDRVPLLRERLGVSGEGNTYDKELAAAVAEFQKNNGIKPDGNLGAATVSALNGPKLERTADIIIANMERWRWMPHDLGKSHVVLNVPDFTLRVIHNGALYWQTKVVVGKPTTPTPLLSADMKYITVNPTWNVPPSIVYNEYLPALQQDPTVLQRMGLRLTQNPDGSVHIAQPPGDGNALGRIRFNFPNKFLVYQHDTPDKYLFARDKRAYSHGCMRVEDPIKYGEVLLSILLPKEGYTKERLRSMFGHSEVDIRFPSTLPVHITYQTAFVDDHGHLQIREDLYGRDAKMLAILKGSERKVADIPVERSQPSYSRPPVQLPPGVAGANGYSPGGPSFFDLLFGQRPAPPPARISQRRTITR
jgi:murein L,D-transpeptidase YcbB/YkuD